MNEIDKIKKQVLPIVKRNKIRRAGIFGSFATGSFTNTSDVDILVELGNNISLLDFVRIKLDLEDSLQRKVDLVEYKAIKPRLRKQILEEEIRIYG
jgi:predicted nucleotidyltransferase